jgi:acyl-CoA dehydrogenase
MASDTDAAAIPPFLDLSLFDLPLFEARHLALARHAADVARRVIAPEALAADDATRCEKACVRALRACAAEGLLAHLVPADWQDSEGETRPPDLRSVCAIREALGAVSGAIDATFAVQGLGSLPIAFRGSAELKARHLPSIVDGSAIAAFALTEPNAGSDVRALTTTARRGGDRYVLDGEKVFISNGPIATVFTVFAKVIDAAAAASAVADAPIAAFVVDAATPGLRIAERLELIAPHPIARLAFDSCAISASQRLGGERDGLKIALMTLDFFRTSVGAAACGMAARALAEAIAHTRRRSQFGQPLFEFQATQLAIGEMLADLEAARLLVYRSAWRKDAGAARVTREASAAKLFATEAAQRIIDRAVQLHGGIGVQRGVAVERLYREIRALRIYEGTSEIQKLLLARQAAEIYGAPVADAAH